MSTIKVKTTRMKEKDKLLGVLNMPEATKVCSFCDFFCIFLRWMLKKGWS